MKLIKRWTIEEGRGLWWGRSERCVKTQSLTMYLLVVPHY